MNTLERFKQFVNEINSTNGRIEKENILKSWSTDQGVKDIIYFVFNPYIVTGVSKKKFNKQVLNDWTYDCLDIEDVMNYLKKHNTGSDRDIANIQHFVLKNPDYTYLIYQIVCKDLTIGLQPKTLNKVFGKGFIPTFEVQLAEKYFDNPEKYLPEGTRYMISEKLDGCVIGTTKVITNKGLQRIQYIAKNKDPELKVLTYNEESKELEYKEILDYLEKPLDKPLVCLELENGEKIKVTEDDYFLLTSGEWVKAKDIKEGDDIVSFEPSFKFKCPDPRCKYGTNDESNFKFHLAKCKYVKEQTCKAIEDIIENNNIIDKYQSGISLYELSNTYGIHRNRIEKELNKKGISIRGSKEQLNTQVSKNKHLETNMERYGCKVPSQTDEVKDKVKNTIRKRYGVDNCSQIDGIQEKNKRIKIEKYGTLKLCPLIIKPKTEELFENYLKELNIEYEKQFTVKKDNKYNRYEADFYIQNKNLIVEIYGNYWHANPKYYKDNDFIYLFSGKTPAKEVRRMNEERENFYKEKGFNILVIWEDSLKTGEYKEIFNKYYESL